MRVPSATAADHCSGEALTKSLLEQGDDDRGGVT
jgi:hypothetical protein